MSRRPPKAKCGVCGEGTEFLYHIKDASVCLACFHAADNNSAFKQLGYPISKDQAARVKLFK